MGFLHALVTIVAIPYALLATAFLMVGGVARSKGMFEVLTTLFNYVDGIARWGIYLVPLVCIALAAAGFVPGLRRVAAMSVMGVAVASLLIICILHSTRLGVGQLVFLAPLVGVIATAWWLFTQASRVAAAP